MLAIKINPNSMNWKMYDFNIMFKNAKFNKFGRCFEMIHFGEMIENLFSEKNTNDLEVDIISHIGLGLFSLDAINNSEICKDFKIGYFYGLNKNHLGEDAILISKIEDSYCIVGFILNLEYMNAKDFRNINPHFLSKWLDYFRQMLENKYGKLYLDLFENYKRKYISNSMIKTRKDAFNARYSDLFIFGEKDRILIDDELKHLGNFQTRKWISEINPDVLQRIIPNYKKNTAPNLHTNF